MGGIPILAELPEDFPGPAQLPHLLITAGTQLKDQRLLQRHRIRTHHRDEVGRTVPEDVRGSVCEVLLKARPDALGTADVDALIATKDTVATSRAGEESFNTIAREGDGLLIGERHFRATLGCAKIARPIGLQCLAPRAFGMRMAYARSSARAYAEQRRVRRPGYGGGI